MFYMWLAGQVDGDGNIGLYSNQARLFITKADKSITTLQHIQQHLGGAIYSYPSKRPRCQAKSSWVVTGRAALRVIKAIMPYTHVKRRQCETILQTVPGRYHVRAFFEGKEVEFETKADLAVLMGVTRTSLNDAFNARSGRKICVRGYELEDVTKEQPLIAARLKQLKLDGHETPKYPIHPAYIAGFFDADGHIALQGPNPYVVITQKHAGVLLGFQKQYGGKVSFSRRCHYWAIRGGSSRAFLKVIKQFVFEKARQVSIALEADKDTWRDKEQDLRRLRGNGGKNKVV